MAVAGLAAGCVNGLFGGGGGIVLLPLLTKWGRLESRRAFATCVAVILPMCCLSAFLYVRRVEPPLWQVLPYLAGGVAGGLLGGLTFRKVPVRWLQIIFGLFLLYGGVRYLL